VVRVFDLTVIKSQTALPEHAGKTPEKLGLRLENVLFGTAFSLLLTNFFHEHKLLTEFLTDLVSWRQG
jgi:hypothetical protein